MVGGCNVGGGYIGDTLAASINDSIDVGIAGNIGVGITGGISDINNVRR